MYTHIPLLDHEMHELRHSYVNFTLRMFTFQYVRYCCQKAYVHSQSRGGVSLSNIVTLLNPLIMNHSYAIAWVEGSVHVQVLPMQMFWANKPSRGLMFDCLLFEVV